jgi:hypothetical protein
VNPSTNLCGARAVGIAAEILIRQTALWTI